MTVNEDFLQNLSDDVIKEMSPEEIEALLKSSDLFAAPVEAREINYEELFSNLEKNEIAADWIGKEGDKARAFVAKMEGLKDNPNVSPNIKEIISKPEGMVGMYYQIDVKYQNLAKNEKELYHKAATSEDLEVLKELDRYQSYSDLMKNDAAVLSAEHWEQCYRTTSQAEGTLLETLEDECRIYDVKQKIPARKSVLNNVSTPTVPPMTPSTSERTTSESASFSKTYTLGKITPRQSKGRA